MSQEQPRIAPSRLSHLDLLRGLAALAVAAGHLRAFLFVDFGQVQSAGVFDRMVYLATGLGHQAVMVFFVLSGYLVGGSVLTAFEDGRWSWRSYALRRLTRLWIVLLPAMVLTLALDWVGQGLSPAGYQGAFASVHHSGPTPDSPADWAQSTFWGNIFFLQTITVGIFGTNGPLWSLAYEFWYYLLFPLFWSIVAIGRAGHTAVAPDAVARIVRAAIPAIILGTLIWWLPLGLLWNGMIWLFGVGAFWLGRRTFVRRVCGHDAWLIGAGGLSLASLAASKTSSVFGSDAFIGFAFALWVVGLASTSREVPWVRSAGVALSDISYTMYVVHFPLLAFIFYCYLGGEQLQPSFGGYARFALLLAAVLTCSKVVWWCFERNTLTMRNRLDGLLPGRAAGGATNRPA